MTKRHTHFFLVLKDVMQLVWSCSNNATSFFNIEMVVFLILNSEGSGLHSVFTNTPGPGPQ